MSFCRKWEYWLLENQIKVHYQQTSAHIDKEEGEGGGWRKEGLQDKEEGHSWLREDPRAKSISFYCK